MKKVVYHKRRGAHIKDKDVQSIGSRLMTLRKKYNGKLTAEDIWSDAKNPESIFHGYIDWNKAHAAKQYQLMQARWLMKSVQVEVINIRKEPQMINVLEHISLTSDNEDDEDIPDGGAYMHYSDIMKNDTFLKKHVRKLKDLMNYYRQQLSVYQNCDGIITAMNDLIEELDKVA